MRADLRLESRAVVTRLPRATRGGAHLRPWPATVQMSPPDTRAISLRSGEIAGSANEGSGATVLDSWPLWLDIPSGCIAPSSASPAIASALLVNPAAIPAGAGWLCLTDVLPVCVRLRFRLRRDGYVKKRCRHHTTAHPVATLQSHGANGSLANGLDVTAKSNFLRPLKVKEKQRCCAPVCRLHMTRVHSRGRDSEERLSFDERLAHTRIRKAERNGWDSMAAAALP